MLLSGSWSGRLGGKVGRGESYLRTNMILTMNG